MSEIVAVKKINGEKFLAEVVLDKEEYLNLAGHTDSLYMFTDKISFMDTNISQRGKNAATKYFLIPTRLRKNLNFNSRVSVQRIDADERVLFVYVVDNMATA